MLASEEKMSNLKRRSKSKKKNNETPVLRTCERENYEKSHKRK